uniref:BMERB domain-containing protein n=1 Tax=Trichuris muris TaxID=70415 RepID=A0A5S6QMZ1_TRIMR
MGADIMNRCHPSNVQPMQRWLSLLRSRWGETDLLLTQRTQRLKDQLLSMQEQDILLDDLIEWMMTKEKKLNKDRRAEVRPSVEQIKQLIREHELFENELRQASRRTIAGSKPIVSKYCKIPVERILFVFA